MLTHIECSNGIGQFKACPLFLFSDPTPARPPKPLLLHESHQFDSESGLFALSYQEWLDSLQNLNCTLLGAVPLVPATSSVVVVEDVPAEDFTEEVRKVWGFLDHRHTHNEASSHRAIGDCSLLPHDVDAAVAVNAPGQVCRRRVFHAPTVAHWAILLQDSP